MPDWNGRTAALHWSWVLRKQLWLPIPLLFSSSFRDNVEFHKKEEDKMSEYLGIKA